MSELLSYDELSLPAINIVRRSINIEYLKEAIEGIRTPLVIPTPLFHDVLNKHYNGDMIQFYRDVLAELEGGSCANFRLGYPDMMRLHGRVVCVSAANDLHSNHELLFQFWS